MEEAMSETAGETLGRIEQELRRYWSTPPPPGEMPTAHASTRNLVVVGDAPEIATRWAAIVDDVLQLIPARAIVVGLDPDGPDGLEASSSAVCAPARSGEPAICSERVTMIARGAACARLASCVDTLCASDVPTTLVWLGRVHTEDPAFAPLARDADRIILDAGHGSLASLAQVVRWVGALPVGDRPGVADLAWTRLAPWQELCARMFDEPHLRELPSGISRIVITQSANPRAALGSEGGLMLGWLATRLGLKAASLAGKLRLVRPNDGSVRLELRTEPAASGRRGALYGVEIEAITGEVRMRAAITCEKDDEDSALWRREITHAGESQRLEQRVRLRSSELSPLLERTLRRPRYDETLAESATWADELRDEEVACA
jgi:glucose-6-phosphate dehydrogenase assembly protein OpcA